MTLTHPFCALEPVLTSCLCFCAPRLCFRVTVMFLGSWLCFWGHGYVFGVMVMFLGSWLCFWGNGYVFRVMIMFLGSWLCLWGHAYVFWVMPMLLRATVVLFEIVVMFFCVFQYSPFTKITSLVNGSQTYDGFCIELLNVMAEQLHFRYYQFYDTMLKTQRLEIKCFGGGGHYYKWTLFILRYSLKSNSRFAQ